VQPCSRSPEVELVGDDHEVLQVPRQVDAATIAIRISRAGADRSWTRGRALAVLLRMTSRTLTVGLIGLAMTGLLASCGSSGDDGTTGTADPPAEATAAATCTDGSLSGRHYILCTAGDTAHETVLVALHGRGSSAAEMQAATELDRDAAARGLAVVYPDASDGRWADDTFARPGHPAGDEDVRFLDRLIEDLRSDPRIGDGPVGMVGFSNGASMALRYAAERPDQVRAVVSVAGQLPRDAAIRPAGRVPLLEVYGTADPIRPYDTGIPDAPDRQPDGPTPTLPTQETVAAFADGADHEGPTATDPDPDDGTSVQTERWTDGARTVAVLHTIVDGGHTWPSSHAPFTGSEGFGAVSRDLDASAEAVAFVLDAAPAGGGGGSGG
jgi:polyhydroxybutyrate depolymerase